MIILYVLYYIVLHYTILYYTMLCYVMSYYIITAWSDAVPHWQGAAAPALEATS